MKMPSFFGMSKMALIVVGIDFGTTFSGWAYSTHDDFATDPTKIFAPQWNSSDQMISLKTPTCILIKPDGKTVDTFGYDAENRYTQLAADEIHKDWYFFRRFKMKLYDAQETIAQSTMLKDETGKELKALTVFSLSIKCLKDDFYDHLSRSICGKFNTSDIHWVLTVPAIWDEPAKQFMRTSAQEAGLEIEHLSLALEPEAASIYCRHAKMIRTENLKTQGTRYLVCDTGGGTVDITVHEVTPDLKLKEIEKASGGDWGGTKVDEEFENHIDTLAGCHVMRAVKNKNMEDYIRITRAFELKKRTCKKSPTAGKYTIVVPISIRDIVKEMTGYTFNKQVQRSKYGKTTTVIGEKIRCSESDLSALFNRPVNNIITKLTSILSKYVDNPINHIIMVGGFSESPLLQDAVREAFPAMQVIIPIDAGLAVLRGAVLFGQNENQIISRVSKFTYGIKVFGKYNPLVHSQDKVLSEGPRKGRVENCFSKLVEIDKSIRADEPAGKRTYDLPVGQSTFNARIFATKEKNPIYVDDEGCLSIGSFNVNCKDRLGNVSSAEVTMYFGGTEIKLKAKMKSTGQETVATFNLPE